MPTPSIERKPIAFRAIPQAALFEHGGALWVKVGARTARHHTTGTRVRFRVATVCRISDKERRGALTK